jgi:hypothetical protein
MNSKISERYNLLKKRDQKSSEIKNVNTKMETLTRKTKEYKEQIFYKNTEEEQQTQTNKLFMEFQALVNEKQQLEQELFDLDNLLFS